MSLLTSVCAARGPQLGPATSSTSISVSTGWPSTFCVTLIFFFAGLSWMLISLASPGDRERGFEDRGVRAAAADVARAGALDLVERGLRVLVEAGLDRHH